MHHNYPSRLRSALCVLGRRSGDAFLILKVRFGAKADLKFAVWAISGAARDRPRDRAGREVPEPYGLLVVANSEAVARKYFLQVTDGHFDKAG